MMIINLYSTTQEATGLFWRRD